MGTRNHSDWRAIVARPSGSADTRSNQNRPIGVAAPASSTAVAAALRPHEERRSAGTGRARSISDTTTSLKAKPRLLTVNVLPESTGHAASDSSAFGMRLIAADDSGSATKLMSGVIESGA